MKTFGPSTAKVCFALIMAILIDACSHSPQPKNFAPNPAPSAVPDPKYWFGIENVQVNKLRSRVSDTDLLRLSVSVDGNEVGWLQKDLGDVKAGAVRKNDGTDDGLWWIGPIGIPTTAKSVVISLVINNTGNAEQVQQWAWLKQLQEVFSIATEKSHDKTVKLINQTATQSNGIWEWIFADCDGVVAVYTKETSGSALTPFSESKKYVQPDAEKTPRGCSVAKSDYELAVKVTNVKPPEVP